MTSAGVVLRLAGVSTTAIQAPRTTHATPHRWRRTCRSAAHQPDFAEALAPTATPAPHPPNEVLLVIAKFVQERLAAFAVWLLQHLLRRALLDDPLVGHQHDPVGSAPGETHLMGNHDHRHALVGQGPHHLEHFTDQLWVQGGCRLVEQHHLGVHRERPGDCDPLLLSTRQVVGVLLCLFRETDSLEQLLGPGSRLFARTVQHVLLRHRDVVDDLHVWEQVERLEDHADPAPDVVEVLLLVDQLLTDHVDGALLDPLQPVDAAQQRALARTRGTDQHDHLAAVDHEVHAVKDHRVPEPLDDAPHLHKRLVLVPALLFRGLLRRHGVTSGAH